MTRTLSLMENLYETSRTRVVGQARFMRTSSVRTLPGKPVPREIAGRTITTAVDPRHLRRTQLRAASTPVRYTVTVARAYALARLRTLTEEASKRRRVAPTSSWSWSMLVALAMGAVRPGLAISHARAI
jgi:hypothetical protein